MLRNWFQRDDDPGTPESLRDDAWAKGNGEYYVRVAAPDTGASEHPRPTETDHEMEEASSSVVVRRQPHPTTAPSVRSAHIVCVANQKGGVGKTTTAVSLAASLAEAGVDVLLVDLDPQGNATTGLGLRVEEGEPSTYTVVVDGMPITEATIPTAVDRLRLVPSSLDLAGADIELVPAFSRELRLRQALDPVRGDHDLVIVDCPPTLGLLTVNALVAADEVLLPIQCEYYALEGVGQLVKSIELVRRSLNPDLAVVGVVLTMFDGRTRLAEQVASEVRDYFGERVFRTVIPRSVRLSEAPGFGQPITVFDPTSRGALAYRRLARELAERLTLVDAPRSPLDVPTDDHQEESP